MDEREAVKSLFNSNYHYWFPYVDGQWRLILNLSAHVDDLQVVGGRTIRDWIHDRLKSRFGTLQRQFLPYPHAGIQQGKVNADTVRLHQDYCWFKMTTFDIGKHRIDNLKADLDSSETATFRSLTCIALWAAPTNPQEACQIRSLQQALNESKLKDLMAINGLPKRLKSHHRGNDGIHFRRPLGPYHAVTVSDASPANKKSDCATEGVASRFAEDCVGKLDTDKSQRLGALEIREELRTLQLRRWFHWQNHWMIVDLLTKYNGYVSKSLFQLLTSSTWIIAGEIRARHNFWKIPGQV